MAQRSRYLSDGQTFHDDRAEGGMWKDCPHPALLNPLSGYAYFNDFHNFSEDEWTITVVSIGTGTSTVATTARAGGMVRVNTAANEDDGGQAQLDSISFALPAAGSVWFEASVDITDDVTQSDAFVGLLALDTSIIAGVPNNHVYFHKDDGDANWDFASDKAGTPTAVAAVGTAVVDTRTILGFKWDGTSLTPYFDGVAGTAITTNIPTVAMSISLGYLNGAAAAQNEGMDVDWIRCVVLTDRT